MTAICLSVCTWFAASPAPSYSRMVSIMSSMSRWISGVRTSSGGTGLAGRRSTGWPRRATFRIAMTSPSLARGLGGLLRLDLPHPAHALAEAPRVGLEEAPELLPLLEHDRGLELVHRGLERRLLHRRAGRVAQLRQHRLGRPRRREDPRPDVELGPTVAELREGRHVRQRRDTLVTPAAERAKLAGLDVRQHDGRARGERVHVAAQDRGERRARARVRHVTELDPGGV